MSDSCLRRVCHPVIALAMSIVVVLALAPHARAQRDANPPYEPPAPDVVAAAPNLFLHRPVTASPHWSDRGAAFAVDGRHDDPRAHWAAENIPVHLTIDLGGRRAINVIDLWTYWGDGRFYQYFIEGSADGQKWSVLADERDNATRATAAGRRFIFGPAEVRYVRTTFTGNSAGNRAGGHIVEIAGYSIAPDEIARLRERERAWQGVEDGLHGAVGSLDERYGREDVPGVSGARQWTATAWRGERVHGQAVLWTPNGARQVRWEVTDLKSSSGAGLSAARVGARFVRYVGADGAVVADALDTINRLDLPPRTSRPVWITIDVPADTEPGVYDGTVLFRAAGQPPVSIDLALEVLPLTLPAPRDWSFHLDLWQNPYAVARYHHVEPWSDEHFALMAPHLRTLADAGQKCLTTTIIHQPWGTQTYDPYESMVHWTRRADGSWSFDYSIFDRYVAFAATCRLDGMINCYSMVPWTNRVRYFDEATGDYESVSFKAGDSKFIELWTAFLTDFTAHLRKKGWADRTAIAMDERPLAMMRPTIALVRRVAPELKIALAGKNEPQLAEDIDDWCVFISPPLDEAIVARRTAAGRPTTFYVCCSPPRPNTFTASPPAESAWIGLYAAARGYSGFLRWAYDSWTADPLRETKHVTWSAGDCFLVYPSGRSSIRFERLREGIADYEKIRILRELADPARDAPELAALEESLARFSYDAANQRSAAVFVNGAKRAIEALSRAVAARRGGRGD